MPDGDVVIVECIGNLFRVCVGSVLVVDAGRRASELAFRCYERLEDSGLLLGLILCLLQE